MNLRIVGAALPRTGTSSLKAALERPLGGRCYHMSVIPGHPFELGAGWNRAMAGEAPHWDRLFDEYIAAVDWPASSFWRELSEANPDALVLLSVRDTVEAWLRSFNEMILSIARLALTADWKGGRDLLTLLERFTGTQRWDDPAVLKAAYERHNAEVRKRCRRSGCWSGVPRGVGADLSLAGCAGAQSSISPHRRQEHENRMTRLRAASLRRNAREHELLLKRARACAGSSTQADPR